MEQFVVKVERLLKEIEKPFEKMDIKLSYVQEERLFQLLKTF